MDKIYSNSEIMKGVLEGLISDADKKKMEESSSFISIWRSILYSIKSVVNPNSGSNMFFHSRVIDIKDTTLVLEVDHSGFIQLFETHKKSRWKSLPPAFIILPYYLTLASTAIL